MEDAICNGHGILRCRCCGDLCLCGLDGEECYGCDKCERPDELYEEDENDKEAKHGKI